MNEKNLPDDAVMRCGICGTFLTSLSALVNHKCQTNTDQNEEHLPPTDQNEEHLPPYFRGHNGPLGTIKGLLKKHGIEVTTENIVIGMRVVLHEYKIPTLHIGLYYDKKISKLVIVGADFDQYALLERVIDACGNNSHRVFPSMPPMNKVTDISQYGVRMIVEWLMGLGLTGEQATDRYNEVSKLIMKELETCLKELLRERRERS